MFKHRTLFIVGAGASSEFGLPVGSALAATIADRLDIKTQNWNDLRPTGDIKLFAKVTQRWSREDEKFLQAAWQIRDGVRLSASIDDFLDVHSSNKYVHRLGKAAIVKTILEYERQSQLYFDRTSVYNKMKLPSLEGTWLIKLMRILSEESR